MEMTSYMLPFDIFQQEVPEKKPEETPDKKIPNKQPERYVPDIPHKNPDPTQPQPDPGKIEPPPIQEPDRKNPAKLIWFLEKAF
ncbi:MAG: hypothetical protein V4590_06620 [Bacteroidota bacterium]